MDTVSAISAQFEAQSLNAVVAGFSFAAAIAWMEAVRFIISQIVKANPNSGSGVFMLAVATTLLSIVVYLVLSRISKRVAPPPSTVYAVTGAK
jgi:hypothetical protein